MKEIREKILSRGYSKDDVDAAVRALDKEKPVFPKKGASSSKKKSSSAKRGRRTGFREPVSRREGAFRWMRLAGIIGLVFFVIILLDFVLGFFDVNLFPSGTELWIKYLNFAISLVVATAFCFYYFGFIKLGKFAESRLLRISSIVFMVFSVIFLLLFILSSVLSLFELPSTADPIGLEGSQDVSNIWGYVFLGLFIISVVFRYLFVVGLMKIRKKVKFSLVAGIIGMIGVIMVTLLIGFFVYLRLYPMKTIMFLFSIGPQLLTIIKIIGYSFYAVILGSLLFESLALLSGSKKFE
jgi:hypothetical protein